MRRNPQTTCEVIKISRGKANQFEDTLITEEPLQIDIVYDNIQQSQQRINLAVTMRTPGNDIELTKGFLLSEGIVNSWKDIEKIETSENRTIVYLQKHLAFDAKHLSRNVFSNSSCGICGKANIESIDSDSAYLPWSEKWSLDSTTILQITEQLSAQELLFDSTGGNHFAALLDQKGKLINLFEDVGRHNAMDKLIGSADAFPLSKHMVLWSGRSSFELVQKAAKAGIPITLSLGAPSSLAVELAEEHGMTLVGFLKKNQFNIYANPQRIKCIDELDAR